jgi:lysophospholipase L1-like esterase
MQRAQFTRMWHSVATNFHASRAARRARKMRHNVRALIHSHSRSLLLLAAFLRVQFGQIIQTIRRKNAQMCSCHPVPVGLVNRFLNCAVNTARTKNATQAQQWENELAKIFCLRQICRN